MVAHKLTEKAVVSVLDKIIKADSAADKHFFYTFDFAQTAKDIKIFRVRNLHVRAGLGCKAFSVFAQAQLFLLFAGRKPEIRSGSSDVADISLKTRIVKKAFCLVYHALLAAHRHGSSLMKSQRTKIAGSKAASVVGDRKLHLGNSRNSACAFIAFRIPSFVRQRVYPIKLICVERRHRRILDQKPVAVSLDQGFSSYCVSLVKLFSGSKRVIPFAFADSLIRRKLDHRGRNVVLGCY